MCLGPGESNPHFAILGGPYASGDRVPYKLQSPVQAPSHAVCFAMIYAIVKP